MFKLDATGKETVLYRFTGGADGAQPFAGVILDAHGNLYGTTFGGGVYGQGTVFKVDTTRNETVLYSFTGGADGAQPRAGVILDAEDNLYGTASVGGNSLGEGTVFKVDTSGKEQPRSTPSLGHQTDFTPKQACFWMRRATYTALTLWGARVVGNTAAYGTVFKVDASATRPCSTPLGVNRAASFPPQV